MHIASLDAAAASTSAIAKTTRERTALSRQIAATGAGIDRLLYGLTDEEIRLVEEATMGVSPSTRVLLVTL
jgi:hypothetical protein